MRDPTGLSGAIVSKLLDVLITQTSNTIYCRKYCKDLHNLLQNIQPLVEPLRSLAAANPPARDCYSDTGGPGLPGPDAVSKWSDDLLRVLEEAHSLVSQCNSTSQFNYAAKNKLSRKILKITQQIQTISTTYAPLANLNISREILQEVRAKNQLQEGPRAQLQINLNARAVGGTTQAILQIEGMQPAQATLEIRSQTNTLAASVFRDIGQTSISPENDPEDGSPSSYTLRPVPEKTFGMDIPLAKLQDLLVGEIQNMKWVGVYGKGGIGKTLLAERAYNSEAVQDHFQNRSFWLTVGKNPSVERLQNKLCDMLRLRNDGMESREEGKAKLCNALRGKKVLLVFDDVWEDDGVPVLDWLDITSGWDSGSKILVTTRNFEVLERKHAQDVSTVKMESLPDGESWELFCEFAFGGVHNIPTALDKLGRAVADECKGLPLALKVIAGAQAGQRSAEQWQRALKKLKEAETLNVDHQEQLYNRLQLSYDSLESLEPDHRQRLQKCFIYFAGFPEDSDVDSEKLVSLWAGEKLLEGGDDIDDEMGPSIDGNYLLGMLIGRSLIDLQKARWSHNVNSLKLTCRVHDVLRDLARRLVHQGRAPIDCLFSAGEGLKKFPDRWLTSIRPGSCLEFRSPKPRGLVRDATHLSLNDNLLESLPTKLKAPRLEVLLLANNGLPEGPSKLVISPGFWESFPSLKVLDLEHSRIESLPESVKNLRNLIYLELSLTGLLNLPRGLRKLTKLEHLGLRGCSHLEPWPFDISCLRSLTFLNTRGCGNVWKPKIGSGACSQISPTPADSLDSLCSLTALRNLSISVDREHLPSKMSSLVHLRHLSIFLVNLKTLPPELHSSDGPRLSKLQYLSLDNCMSLSELPSWAESLPELKTLNLVLCRTLKSLPNLHRLQELRKLDLSFCTSLQKLPDGFTSNGAFAALTELYMAECQGLSEFPPIEGGAFPQLMILDLTGCPFQNLPSSLSLLPKLGKLNLNLCKRLTNLDNCFSLQGRVSNNSTSQLRNTSPYFPNLRELGLKEVPLDSLPPDLAACPTLKKIDLRNSLAAIPGKLQTLQEEGKLNILVTSP